MLERPSTTLSERLFWFSGWVYDFSKVATLLLVIGLTIHYFFFTILVVRGKSMLPTYHDGQILTVNKIAYLIDHPHRGDVIAMYFPGETEKRFIKRIIALPGEKIQILGGQVLVNDKVLDESYLPDGLTTQPDMDRLLVAGEYFAMGDNRQNSSDSRAWGPVPESFIVGKAGRVIFRLGDQD